MTAISSDSFGFAGPTSYLCASFDTGTWQYSTQTQSWMQLTEATASQLHYGDLNNIYGGYNGLWNYNFVSTSWTQINTEAPYLIAN
jgi:hypothetical protein